MVKEGKKITGPEQLKDAAYGCARIRGDTLGIVGLGTFLFTLSVCRSVKFSSSTQHTDIYIYIYAIYLYVYDEEV